MEINQKIVYLYYTYIYTQPIDLCFSLSIYRKFYAPIATQFQLKYIVYKFTNQTNYTTLECHMNIINVVMPCEIFSKYFVNNSLERIERSASFNR
jgi:hypothetical protein